MAFPTIEKTWQHAVNFPLTDTGNATTNMRTIVKRIVDLITGVGGTFTLGLWTVRYSCDGVAAGVAGDGINRWDSLTDLVWAAAGVAHSWIVLRQTGIGATFEVCIDLSSATVGNGTVVFSEGGFSGGTTTARPTAADEYIWLNNTNLFSSSNTNWHTAWMNVQMSTDGHCTRVILLRGSGDRLQSWFWEKPKTAVSGWSTPFAAYRITSTATQGPGFAARALQTSATIVGKIRVGATAGDARMGGKNRPNSDANGDTAYRVGLGPHELTGRHPLHRAIVVGYTTVGARGRMGLLWDFWIGQADDAANTSFSFRPGMLLGEPDPNSGQLVALGSLVLPWVGDGTACLTW